MTMISQGLILLIIFYMIIMGLLSGRPVFDDFLVGAKKGLQIVVNLLPTLLGLIIAVGVMRSSGFLEQVGIWMSYPARYLHISEELIPVAVIRLISNSAATGLLLDIFKEHGPDSLIGFTGSIMLSSTETIVYCLSVYYGTFQIRKIRYTLWGALLASLAGIIASIIIANLMF